MSHQPAHRRRPENMPSSAPPPIVLVFAGTDPTGGAGIQADLLTLASMGCHALSVVTAITIQDTAGVDGVLAIDSDWVVDQARLVLEDMPVVAFKVGMVGSVENIAAIAERTKKRRRERCRRSCPSSMTSARSVWREGHRPSVP